MERSQSFNNGCEINQNVENLASIERGTSMLDFRELEDIKIINEMLHLNESELFDKEDLIESGDDYGFFDIKPGEECSVPLNFHDDSEEKERRKETFSIERACSTNHIDEKKTNDGVSISGLSQLEINNPKQVKQKRSSLKKNPSFGTLNTSDSETKSKVDDDEPKMKRNVSFTSLEFREYDVTLGDNPAVRKGPPISLSWQYNEAGTFDVEKFEASRGPRRSRNEMLMGSHIRRFILRENAGFTPAEIKEATDLVMKIKKNRSQSISRMHMSRLEEALESAVRKAKRVIPKIKS